MGGGKHRTNSACKLTNMVNRFSMQINRNGYMCYCYSGKFVVGKKVNKTIGETKKLFLQYTILIQISNL